MNREMKPRTELRRVTVCALALALGACATTRPEPRAQDAAPPVAAEPAAIAENVAAEPREASLGVVSTAPGSGAPAMSADAGDAHDGETEATRAMREVFQSARFGKHLAKSYLAVTDVEPLVTAVEHEKVVEISEAIQDERYEEALKLIDKHKKNEDSSPVFEFLRGGVLEQQERLDEAAAAYQAAIDGYQRFLRAWQGLARIHMRQERYAEAIPGLVEVLQHGGRDAINYGLLGIAYLQTGRHLSAESAFRMAALMDPETIQWRMYLADCFFKQERFRDAIALLEELIAEQPDKSELWLLQASAFIRLDEPMRAAENYELIDKLGASNVESLGNLGDIYVNADLYGPGVDAHLRAMELDRQATARALTAGRLLTARGALDDVKTLLAGIEAAGADDLPFEVQKDMLKLRSRVAVAEGADDEEARVLEEIVELDPLDGEALILLGRHAARNEDAEKAVFLYERAANVEGFEAEAKMRHGELLVDQGRYAEGLVLLRKSQELRPRDFLVDYIDKVERIAQNR